MALVTGTPDSPVTAQEELYIEGASYLYMQDYRDPPLNAPDAQGYYWGLVTGTYPVSLIGCVTNVSLTEGVTMNDVRCDTIGVKDTIQKRDYVEFQLEVLSLFPLSISSILMKLSDATVGTGYEKVGIGQINNNRHYMLYAPKVYDETTASWLVFHLHKVKVVDAFTLPQTYGQAWQINNIKIRAFADSTKPAGQEFGVIARFDTAALP